MTHARILSISATTVVVEFLDFNSPVKYLNDEPINQVQHILTFQRESRVGDISISKPIHYGIKFNDHDSAPHLI